MRERNILIIRGLQRDIGGYVFGEREREGLWVRGLIREGEGEG